MAQLMAASHQWRTRPPDERFTSLIDMQELYAKIASAIRKQRMLRVRCVTFSARLPSSATSISSRRRSWWKGVAIFQEHFCQLWP